MTLIPNCWWKHPALVEELSALHVAWRTAYDKQDTGLGPVMWLVFNDQARHVVDSLRKGDSVLVAGDLRFGSYTDKDDKIRESRDIVADTVAASLRHPCGSPA